MKRCFLKILCAFVLLLTINQTADAQNKLVIGKVTNESGAPISSASVLLKGTANGTSTDSIGAFSITAPGNGVLVVSYVGYTEQDVRINNRTEIPVVLKAGQSTQLSDVVVIGYGSAKKGDLTGPITTVNTENMLKRTTATPMDAIQGSVPGVQVVSNGAPGSSPEVRVRGVGSFNNTSPLYVVDGIFLDDIGFLNPNDIAEMSILKDASGSAIYGVKAANGVVLITTKKGRLNMKPQVTYNGYAGFQMPRKSILSDGPTYTKYLLSLNSAADSVVIRKSAEKYGGTGLNPSTNTDWYDELTRSNALLSNQSVTIRGGGEKVTYSIGLNYIYQNGVMKAKNDYTKYNFHLQLDAKLFSWLKTGTTVYITNIIRFNPNNSAFGSAFINPPVAPVYDDDNVDAFPVKFTNPGITIERGGNPVAEAYYNYNRDKQFQVLPTIFTEADFWKNKITFRTQLGQTYSSLLNTGYGTRWALGPVNPNDPPRSSLSIRQERVTNYVLDNLLTYKDHIGLHNWTLLLGQSAREERFRGTSGSVKDIPQLEEAWYLDRGVKDNTYSDYGSRDASLSYFSRLMYNYANKYLLSATIRKDGSSKYQTKWGNFPSVGLGWVISKEKIMKNQSVFDLLKIRGSWGRAGNDKVRGNAGFVTINQGLGQAAIFGSTGTADGQYVSGYSINYFFKPLTWEVTETWDGGIDFEMLNRRLTGTIGYYDKVTSSAAFDRPFALVNTSIYGNWAKIKNTGYEFVLSWADKVGKVNYQIGGNFTTLKNTVLDLGGLNFQAGPGVFPYQAELPDRMSLGQPINYFYGFQVAGVYQTQSEVDADPIAENYNKTAATKIQPGFFKFEDINSDGVLDGRDMTNIGNPIPTLTFGFNLSLEYKSFDLSVAAFGQSGNKILNVNRGRLVKARFTENADAKFINGLWTGPGSTNSSASGYAFAQQWNRQPNSFFVENGSFFTIQNIQVGYNFTLARDKSPIKMRVFATADKPFIFTQYSGITPEINNNGYDNNVYPLARTFSVGLNATF